MNGYTNNHVQGLVNAPFSQPNAVKSRFTRVNGIGIWESWRKNFRSPLFALLDLFDNAIDASFDLENGEISVNTCTTNNEMVLKNNCSDRICPIVQILELYKSSKDTSTIGQNGIGSKQACANMSDLSFLITKNNDEVSLGVIAKFLQTEEGPHLPSTTFITGCGVDIYRQLHILDWDLVFSAYGTTSNYQGDDENNANYSSTGIRADDSKKDVKQEGINRIYKHIQELMDDPNPYVFKVILYQVRHNRKKLLKELKDALPMYYMHVPRTLKISINHQRVRFQYWESRLVELSVFNCKIHPTELWHESDWKNSEGGNDMRIFIGFDPYKTQKREAALYIYSRRSGRLCKQMDDARRYLHLNAGSTNFCQGLSIIIDDYKGCLPLTPTKQDLAFSMEVHGATHEINFHVWISAYVNLYYNYHFSRFANKKELLTNGIQTAGKELDILRTSKLLEQKRRGNGSNQSFPRLNSMGLDVVISLNEGEFNGGDDDEEGVQFLTQSLAKGDFTTLVHFEWSASKTTKIYARDKRCIQRAYGRDTVVHLEHLEAEECMEMKQKTKRKPRRTLTSPQPSAILSQEAVFAEVSAPKPAIKMESASRSLYSHKTTSVDSSKYEYQSIKRKRPLGHEESKEERPISVGVGASRKEMKTEQYTRSNDNVTIVIDDDTDDNEMELKNNVDARKTNLNGTVRSMEVSSMQAPAMSPTQPEERIQPRQKMISNKALMITVRKLNEKNEELKKINEIMIRKSEAEKKELCRQNEQANHKIQELESKLSTAAGNENFFSQEEALKVGELTKERDVLFLSQSEQTFQLQDMRKERDALRLSQSESSKTIEDMKAAEEDSRRVAIALNNEIKRLNRRLSIRIEDIKQEN